MSYDMETPRTLRPAVFSADAIQEIFTTAGLTSPFSPEDNKKIQTIVGLVRAGELHIVETSERINSATSAAEKGTTLNIGLGNNAVIKAAEILALYKGSALGQHKAWGERAEAFVPA